MNRLNTLFNTANPILDELADYAAGNDGRIPDHIFSQACTEFNMEEDAVMELMVAGTDEHRFERYDEGFIVLSK